MWKITAVELIYETEILVLLEIRFIFWKLILLKCNRFTDDPSFKNDDHQSSLHLYNMFFFVIYFS